MTTTDTMTFFSPPPQYDGPIRVAIEWVGPEEARDLLAQNPRNRAIKSNKVKLWENALRRGEFRISNSTIAIAASGRLLDGQHRCKAIVNTGIGIWVIVVRGLDEEVIYTMDKGAGTAPSREPFPLPR